MSVYDKEDNLFTLVPELQEMRDFKELYINFNNTIVIKTLSGCEPAAGEAVDCIGLPHVVGSVAGDNTLLLIVDKEEHVEEILAIFNDMLITRSKGQ